MNAAVSRLFDTVVGQPSAVALLSASVDEPVHAYLFVGPTGSGKRTAARSFAALLVDPTGDADGRDARLALAGLHPDVREIERIGPAISAPQASEIVSLAALAPTEGRRKVLVLHDFHLIAPPAASRLLKTIEEPSPSTVFLILADHVPPDTGRHKVAIEALGVVGNHMECDAKHCRLFDLERGGRGLMVVS